MTTKTTLGHTDVTGKTAIRLFSHISIFERQGCLLFPSFSCIPLPLVSTTRRVYLDDRRYLPILFRVYFYTNCILACCVQVPLALFSLYRLSVSSPLNPRSFKRPLLFILLILYPNSSSNDIRIRDISSEWEIHPSRHKHVMSTISPAFVCLYKGVSCILYEIERSWPFSVITFYEVYVPVSIRYTL